ncbi:MAG: ABC transporter ATP-binding protein [Pseudomonadales bacterium]|nr:ABC transporter ATP-binding protein [Pseudomonadales bacterium]
MSDDILQVENLKVEFSTYGGTVKAVRGVSFSVERSKTLAIVGESGCGKSVSVQSIMGLIPMPPGRITSGSAKINGHEIIGLSAKEANKYRGVEIAMIFQDPMSSLNPTMTIGDQISETLMVHKGFSYKEASKQAVELLEKTHIPEAAKRAKQYPFEFSGGMLQRAMIAQSLACNPTILIADEPTTALDVTIQAQILELMSELQQSEGMSIVLITHDLAVVAKMADRVAVMYAGQVIEMGNVDEIFYQSSHPYTLGLKEAMPSNQKDKGKKLTPIAGSPPDLFSPPSGCAYYARCPYAMAICETQMPDEFLIATDGDKNNNQKDSDHYSRCWLQHPDSPQVDSLYQSGRTNVS